MPKATYRVKNWSEYNRSLIQRGSLCVWVEEDVLQAWRYSGPRTPGAPKQYSDLAIEMMLLLRSVYHLPLRATQGLTESIFRQLGVDLPVPHYSTLSRRGQTLLVHLGNMRKDVAHLVIDSSGLKVYGEGEWQMRQHGKAKRRTWRKVHVGVNVETQEFEAVILTEATETDAQQVGPLLDQIAGRIETVGGDGAYDQQPAYEPIRQRGAWPVIPPRRDAKIRQHGNRSAPPLPRDEHLRRIRQVGRKVWKQESGYHRRSLAETAIFRLKTLFGRHLASREFARQITEIRIRVRALNRMTHLGMPQTVRVR